LNEPAISLQGIATAYEGSDRPVITDLSLQVDPGEFVVVAGPNGAGKTTLLEVINGLLPMIDGTATVLGMDLHNNGYAIRRRVGYVLQSAGFDPLSPFSVREVTMMGRYGRIGLLRRPGSRDRARVEETLALLGIDDLADHPIGTLSGGQQQKVLIAQNLAKEPDILLLDEPFSSLDLCARASIATLLSKLSDTGLTIVLVSHIFDDLPKREIHLVLMQDGKICRDTHCLPSEVGGLIRAIPESSALCSNC
jgi:zinc/manganese transport system ATP-binding protein